MDRLVVILVYICIPVVCVYTITFYATAHYSCNKITAYPYHYKHYGIDSTSIGVPRTNGGSWWPCNNCTHLYPRYSPLSGTHPPLGTHPPSGTHFSYVLTLPQVPRPLDPDLTTLPPKKDNVFILNGPRFLRELPE